jgi:thiol-disulfide isomerase/thioredoxin
MMLALLLLSAALVMPPPAHVDVPLRDLAGQRFDLGSFKGRVVVLDVWATWCAPCLAELPTLRSLHDSSGNDLVVIGVNLDRMTPRDLRAWLLRHDVRWRQHYDGRGYASPVAAALEITNLPATLLVGCDGAVVARNLRGAALVSAVKQQRARCR